MNDELVLLSFAVIIMFLGMCVGWAFMSWLWSGREEESADEAVSSVGCRNRTGNYDLWRRRQRLFEQN